MFKKVILAIVGLIVIGAIVVLLIAIDNWLARVVIVGFILATCPKLLSKEPQEQDDFK